LRLENGEPVVLGVLNERRETATKRVCLPVADAPKSMYEILEAMALIIEAERPGKKCSILLVDPESRQITVGAGPSLPEEYNRAVEQLMIGPCVGSCGTAAFWNERVIVEDIQNDPLWTNLKAEAANAGVAACWSHPVVSASGQLLGATALYCPEPCVPTQQELDGLTAAARMFGLAIERSYAELASIPLK
jgi:two-component system, sensor histidine kinase